MPSKDGWTLERDHNKITLGKKEYRNMEEWTRPCGVCGEKFNIYVRANGGMVNSSFGLKTCKEHRGQKIVGGVLDTEELEKLRMANKVMKDELDGLYARNSALFAEVQILKAENETLRNKFAPYELQPAMERQAALPADVVGQQLLQKFKEKMPWDA